jgi:hypothetical protein
MGENVGAGLAIAGGVRLGVCDGAGVGDGVGDFGVDLRVASSATIAMSSPTMQRPTMSVASHRRYVSGDVGGALAAVPRRGAAGVSDGGTRNLSTRDGGASMMTANVVEIATRCSDS